MREVVIEGSFADWQRAARRLLQEAVPPPDISWVVVSRRPIGLLDTDSLSPDCSPASFTVPRRFVQTAERVARHPSPARWSLLYRILWRLVHEGRDFLDDGSDPDIRELLRLEKEVPAMEERLELFTAGTKTFEQSTASPVVPDTTDLAVLAEAASHCTGCQLYKSATQVVFGRGPAAARVALVGEQPGDQEDLKGQPFVGPAGEVLDRALKEAGVSRANLYVTNAVKHFKWEPRGKRRIHQKPNQLEMDACRPWLEAELRSVHPEVIVCLGATAAQTLLGPQFRVMKSRGRMMRTRWAPWLIATLHPSAILRAADPEAAEASYRMLLDDLRTVAAHLGVSR